MDYGNSIRIDEESMKILRTMKENHERKTGFEVTMKSVIKKAVEKALWYDQNVNE